MEVRLGTDLGQCERLECLRGWSENIIIVQQTKILNTFHQPAAPTAGDVLEVDEAGVRQPPGGRLPDHPRGLHTLRQQDSPVPQQRSNTDSHSSLPGEVSPAVQSLGLVPGSVSYPGMMMGTPTGVTVIMVMVLPVCVASTSFWLVLMEPNVAWKSLLLLLLRLLLVFTGQAESSSIPNISSPSIEVCRPNKNKISPLMVH